MKETVSPWLEIWVRPRATIRHIVKENPNRSLGWLAAIYGFTSLLNNAQSIALGNGLSLLAIFLIALLLSPLWGYLFFSIWSGVVFWIGRLFKGAGSFQTVRAAYAWASVPFLVNIPLWILLTASFGSSLFTSSSGGELLSNHQIMLLFTVLILRLVLSIWSLVIYFNALAEVQSYSVLKAILNVVLSAALLMGGVFVVWVVGSSLFAGII